MCHYGRWDIDVHACRMAQSLVTGARNGSFKEDEGKFTAGGYEMDRAESRRARMLYDYDAVNDDELSLHASDVSIDNSLLWK